MRAGVGGLEGQVHLKVESLPIIKPNCVCAKWLGMYFVLLSFNALFCSSLWTVSIICCFVTSRFKRILSWIQFPKTLAVFCSTKYGAIDWITSLLRMDSWSFLIGCLSIWRNVKSESKLLIHSEKSSPGCLSNLLSSKLIKFIWSSQLQYKVNAEIRTLNRSSWGLLQSKFEGNVFFKTLR